MAIDFSKVLRQPQQPKQALTIEELEADYERCSLQEIRDEVIREVQVRERIYLDWIRDNKLSRSDASDRIRRMIGAAVWIGRLIDAPEMYSEELKRAAQSSEPAAERA